MTDDTPTHILPTPPTPTWYDRSRAGEVMDAYNKGGGSAQPADAFVARSLVPAGTGAERDFSYIAPELPELIAENCVACMDCVNNCPDTAILGKIVARDELTSALDGAPDADARAHCEEQFVETVKYFKSFEKKHAKDESLPPGALFGIFIDPTKCKGCAECVEVCGSHNALKMVKKTPDNLPAFRRLWDFYLGLPASPEVYINKKDQRDLMLKPANLLYVGGAGSCMGCGEASVLRQMLATTADICGTNFGIVAATGCNTVYGSTYPYNPYMVPWTNSLFENAPTDAMGIRLYWDQHDRKDWALWVLGGDGAMLDIGFQALSRMLASGLNIKVMILDTQVYSNTGGQTSTGTYIGQEAKMSVHGSTLGGKLERRKEIGNICMMHPNTFVAQTVGPKTNHFFKAIQRALDYNGPAVVNVFTTCQPEHGVADDMAAAQAKLAVDSRAFPMFVYDPDAGTSFHERLSLKGNPAVDRNWYVQKQKDGPSTTVDFIHWARTEGRFRKHFDSGGSPSEILLRSQQERLENWWLLQELAGIENADRVANATAA